jgi:hypothetical protein
MAPKKKQSVKRIKKETSSEDSESEPDLAIKTKSTNAKTRSTRHKTKISHEDFI